MRHHKALVDPAFVARPGCSLPLRGSCCCARFRRRASALGPRQGGQSSLLVVVAVAFAALVALAVTDLGRHAIDAARARTAADAAALAGAADGPEAARDLAAANGGRLASVQISGDVVTVEVVVGEARASASARREGTWCGAEAESGLAISYTDQPCLSTPG